MNSAIVLPTDDNRNVALILFTNGDMKFPVVRYRSTFWATVQSIAAYFQLTERTVERHIANYFEARHGDLKGVTKFVDDTNGGPQEVNYYNLDVITYIGYRAQATERTIVFQDWAVEILRRYLSGELRYAEKQVYTEIRDCISLSTDYDPNSYVCRQYFATIQNKLLFAATGKTAAELIASRADHVQPNMGLQQWQAENIRKADVTVAKNYLSPDELNVVQMLNTAVLNAASFLATRGKPTTMIEWCDSVDLQIMVFRMNVLKSLGKVTHAQAEQIAHREYSEFKKLLKENN